MTNEHLILRTVYLDATTDSLIDQTAIRMNMSRHELMRKLLTEGIEKQKAAKNLRKRTGATEKK